uniref:high mobility group nucleosome-binding domain-containing protein 3-like n=1 Tax=Panthera onca TaxID=9690 RepID=UPI0029545591|nr:high mobility group nucleosome-binding domain-containing protein 3-like [Panthera onca]
MSKRKSPENTEGKDGSKPIEQETTRQSARLSAKPAPPKAEPEPRKTSANKEPGTKTNKGTKRKEGEQEAGKEDTAPFQTKAEKAQKAEPVDHRDAMGSTAPLSLMIQDPVTLTGTGLGPGLLMTLDNLPGWQGLARDTLHPQRLGAFSEHLQAWALFLTD